MNDTEHLESIDAQRALDLLEKAVTERGEDYVYQQVSVSSLPSHMRGWWDDDQTVCVYFDAQYQPSCLVGHALALAGVDPKSVADTYNATTPACLPGVQGPAAEIFRVAQLAQDVGRTWGSALDEARVAAARLGVTS